MSRKVCVILWCGGRWHTEDPLRVQTGSAFYLIKTSLYVAHIQPYLVHRGGLHTCKHHTHMNSVDSIAQNVLHRTQYTIKILRRYVNILSPPGGGQEKKTIYQNLQELDSFYA